MGYLYIFGTLAFTVYGQIILKWRIDSYQNIPVDFPQKMKFILFLLIDPFILSGFFSAFIASLFWMAAMTKFELTRAYPFMTLAPALVFVLGIVLLGEQFSWGKLLGLLIIMLGVFVSARY